MRSISNFKERVIDPHNDKVRKYAKDHFVPKCLLSLRYFFIQHAYATGLKAERDNEDWTPSVHHLEKIRNLHSGST